jgi:ABC-2 type transport system ATP-binding protein
LMRRFNGFMAVDSLELDVEVKEVFGLLGPIGAGKTTTIKMLTTHLPPSGGTAQVDGRNIKTKPSEVRKIIGYVPQMLSADASLTGFENQVIFAKLNDVPKDQVEMRASRC